MNIGYADFLRLLKVGGNPTEWTTRLAVRENGVFVRPLEPALPVTVEERAILAEHPLKDLTKPILAFPCSLDQLRQFVNEEDLHIDAFDLVDLLKSGGCVSDSRARWPWGAYETKRLRALAEAAKKFWVLYDPSDKTSAPKSEDVSRWLQDVHGESSRVADVMASILRADGLPTGPR